LTLLYWNIGNRVQKEILQNKRANYGEEVVASLAKSLTLEFGKGFGSRNLFRMIQFSEVFSNPKIVSSLMAQLGWTHFLHLIRIEDPLKRDFYAEMCKIEKWSTRALEEKIQSMLFERTTLSKKPEKLISKELADLKSTGKTTPDLVFRDPYILDFLGLKDSYSEKDLETAVLREIESFILELGVGFTFVERQKRISLDGVDYYLDLLFYHRDLRRLIAIELKIGDFKPADKGQMELYLAWLKRHEQKKGEESPLGLILCAGKKEEAIELLDLQKSGIQVSSYWTKMLPKAQLIQKLHEAMAKARNRYLKIS
jgi:predicted nuclease of restriction endonuclease-like (RecB) superfamily